MMQAFYSNECRNNLLKWSGLAEENKLKKEQTWHWHTEYFNTVYFSSPLVLRETAEYTQYSYSLVLVDDHYSLVLDSS